MAEASLRVTLDFGSDGLVVELPKERTTVLEPLYPPALEDPRAALRDALRSPSGKVKALRELVRSGGMIAISVCDGTRPQPRELMVRALLDEMPALGRENIVILVATGTHRANTDEELVAMLGAEIAGEFRVVNHDARDPDGLRYCGETSSGVPIWLNRYWVEADFRITTGFVEPHLFAGFSGGPKLVAPGLAGLDTTMELHNAERIGHSNATWGVTRGNPVHDDVREIAIKTGVSFGLDVTLNGNKEITGAFAGEILGEHRLACTASRGEAMRAIDSPFDVVITTNSGFPLDQNLYQAVKGISAAAQIVKDGGVIICAAECRDGLPDHGPYAEILERGTSPKELLELIRQPGFAVADQWQVQVQALVQTRARVMVKSSYLSERQLRRAHFEAAGDVAAAAGEALEAAGPRARLCVLPRGPQTIPYLARR